MFFKNNGSRPWVLLFLPYVWVLIELEGPDVDTEMRTESLVDSGVWACGARKGDELILGRQRAESSNSSAGSGFGVCLRPWCGGGRMLCCGRRCLVGWRVPCPSCLQVAGTPMATRDFIVFFFFLKVLLLIAFFLRTALFPSSLGILVIFIENLLMPSTMVNVYEFCFDDF